MFSELTPLRAQSSAYAEGSEYLFGGSGNSLFLPTYSFLALLKQQLLDWIFPHDIDTKHRFVRSRRVAGCGSWFLDSPEYQNWVTGKSSNVLFCPGLRSSLYMFMAYHFLAGAGKTIMT